MAWRVATAARIAVAAGAAAAGLTLASCGDSTDDGRSRASTAPGGTTTASAESPSPRPALCGGLRTRVLGRVRDRAMDELSGLAVGRARPEVLFAHEDSGSAPLLTALRRDGRLLGRIAVTGAQERDWEDMAALRTRARGAELLVADNGERGGVRVYRVPEPSPAARATAPAVALRLRFPDGSHDTEALLADPLRDEVVVVTKEILGAQAYAGPAAPRSRQVTLRRGPSLQFGLVTAGDVSADGRIVALRSYSDLAVWVRRGRESLLRTLARAPCRADVDLGVEGQGEALALDDSGRAAITASEGVRPPIRRHAPRGG